MEYRKWRRIERHKACAQLLDASNATMHVAGWRRAVPEAVTSAVQPIAEEARAAFESVTKNRLLRVVLKPFMRKLVARMNPGVDPGELDQTLSGVIASITAKAQLPVIDLVSERMGAGADGKLTQFREGASKLGAALESVELICPDRVVRAARDLHEAALELSQKSNEDGTPEEFMSAYRRTRGKFVFEARRDLNGSHFKRLI